MAIVTFWSNGKEETAKTLSIAAIATPYGTGGVGVIRISGAQAFEIIKKILSRGNLITVG